MKRRNAQPRAHYQHTVPQRADEGGHAVTFDRNLPARKRKCTTCGKAITWVQADEGPEMLKAMFRW